MWRRMILTRVRLLMLAVGIVAAVVVLGAMSVNEGELVVLVTSDEASRHHETQLWVVDIDGHQYLRAGSPRAGWLARLEAEPLVVLTRNDQKSSFIARPQREDAALRARVNRAMAAKYGFPDRVISYLTDRDRSVPIELEALHEDVVSEVRPRSPH